MRVRRFNYRQHYSNNPSNTLTAKACEIFMMHAEKVLPKIAKTILDKLSELVDQPASALVKQDLRDAWLAVESAGKAWTKSTNKAWRFATGQAPQSVGTMFDIENGKFELLDNEVMESKILPSPRLAIGLGLGFAHCRRRELVAQRIFG